MITASDRPDYNQKNMLFRGSNETLLSIHGQLKSQFSSLRFPPVFPTNIF